MFFHWAHIMLSLFLFTKTDKTVVQYLTLINDELYKFN